MSLSADQRTIATTSTSRSRNSAAVSASAAEDDGVAQGVRKKKKKTGQSATKKVITKSAATSSTSPLAGYTTSVLRSSGNLSYGSLALPSSSSPSAATSTDSLHAYTDSLEERRGIYHVDGGVNSQTSLAHSPYSNSNDGSKGKQRATQLAATTQSAESAASIGALDRRQIADAVRNAGLTGPTLPAARPAATTQPSSVHDIGATSQPSGRNNGRGTGQASVTISELVRSEHAKSPPIEPLLRTTSRGTAASTSASVSSAYETRSPPASIASGTVKQQKQKQKKDSASIKSGGAKKVKKKVNPAPTATSSASAAIPSVPGATAASSSTSRRNQTRADFPLRVGAATTTLDRTTPASAQVVATSANTQRRSAEVSDRSQAAINPSNGSTARNVAAAASHSVTAGQNSVARARPAGATTTNEARPTASRPPAATARSEQSLGRSSQANLRAAVSRDGSTAASPRSVASRNAAPVYSSAAQSPSAEPAAAAAAADPSGEPPPPPWSAPLTTITLAFTPMHAYLADFDPEPEQLVEEPLSLDSARTSAASQQPVPPRPPIPDSPPPAFRSRPPTPEEVRQPQQRTDTDESGDEAWPDVHLSDVEVLDKGYNSSETSLDLLAQTPAPASADDTEQRHTTPETSRVAEARQWEGLRRKGIDLAERLQRIQLKGKGRAIEEEQLDSTASQVQVDRQVLVPESSALPVTAQPAAAGSSSSAMAAATATMPLALIIGTEQGSESVRPSQPQSKVADPENSSPASSGLSLPKDSTVSSVQPQKDGPRFPSIGTVRRARLKRFEQQRRSSKMLSSVMTPASLDGKEAEIATAPGRTESPIRDGDLALIEGNAASEPSRTASQAEIAPAADSVDVPTRRQSIVAGLDRLESLLRRGGSAARSLTLRRPEEVILAPRQRDRSPAPTLGPIVLSRPLSLVDEDAAHDPTHDDPDALNRQIGNREGSRDRAIGLPSSSYASDDSVNLSAVSEDVKATEPIPLPSTPAAIVLEPAREDDTTIQPIDQDVEKPAGRQSSTEDLPLAKRLSLEIEARQAAQRGESPQRAVDDHIRRTASTRSAGTAGGVAQARDAAVRPVQAEQAAPIELPATTILAAAQVQETPARSTPTAPTGETRVLEATPLSSQQEIIDRRLAEAAAVAERAEAEEHARVQRQLEEDAKLAALLQSQVHAEASDLTPMPPSSSSGAARSATSGSAIKSSSSLPTTAVASPSQQSTFPDGASLAPPKPKSRQAGSVAKKSKKKAKEAASAAALQAVKQTAASSSQPLQAERHLEALPVMTLPRAPPRITSDPLSADNLRKLTRTSARAPSLHSAKSLSSTSSDEDVATLSTNVSDSGHSDSDSADDESTARPPASSLVSYRHTVTPPTLSKDPQFSNESEREAAAASWRRTEDGKRASAILSRPLSIKRKPPPVPPKRWGGIWDRKAVQERLARDSRLHDELESLDEAAAVGEPPSVQREARPSQQLNAISEESAAASSWRTVGRDEDSERPASSGNSPVWEVVGREGSPFGSLSQSDSGRREDRYPPTAPPSRPPLEPSTSYGRQSATGAMRSYRLPGSYPEPARTPKSDFTRDLNPLTTPPANVETPLQASRQLVTEGPDPEQPMAQVSAPRTSPQLHRSYATRRPTSVSSWVSRRASEVPSGQVSARQTVASPVGENVISDGNPMVQANVNMPVITDETRAILNSRPRHVYSASLPNARLDGPPSSMPLSPERPPARPRRPLPMPPVEDYIATSSSVPGVPGQMEADPLLPHGDFQTDSSRHGASTPLLRPPSGNHQPQSQVPRSYRSTVNNPYYQQTGPVASSDYYALPQSQQQQQQREPLLHAQPQLVSQLYSPPTARSTQEPLADFGTALPEARPATAEEIDSLPVGRVELERRRTDKNGRVKQKLACVGISCNRCEICLTQFREDELACVLPMCLHVFHAEPCIRSHLSGSHICPTCQTPIL